MTARVTIKNIHNHIVYNLQGEEGVENLIVISWDYDNSKVDEMMDKEIINRLGDKKKNLMWIEKIKEKANWKEGEELYLCTKCNCDGCFYVWFERNKGWCNMVIEKDGYLSIRTYNNYTTNQTDLIQFSFFVRVESYYNDSICNFIKKKKV